MYELQRGVGTETEPLVAFHLQAGEVEKSWRGLGTLFLLYFRNGERRVADGRQCRLALFLGGESAVALLHDGGEDGVAVDGGQHPVGLWLELFNLLLPLDNERQRGSLYTTDAEYLLLSRGILLGVEAGSVHTQQPVANGTHQTGLVKRLVLVLLLQLLKSLAYGFLSQTAYPETLNGTFCLCHLHYPALYQLALLPGIAAVYNAVRALDKPRNGLELFLHTFVGFQLNAEAFRYHGQLAQAPSLPHWRIVLWLLQLTQMAECPRNLVAVPLHKPVHGAVSSQYLGNFARNGRFLCYTNYHSLFCNLGAKIRKKCRENNLSAKIKTDS